MLKQIIKRLLFNNKIKRGTYHGLLTSTRGKILEAELRLDLPINTVSADLFLKSDLQKNTPPDNYYCSMRGGLLIRQGKIIVLTPQFIFDNQENAQSGGHIELEIQCPQEIKITCLIPEAIPEEYNGNLKFASSNFRVLNIEIDKLKDYPDPPEFSTNMISHGNQPTEIRGKNISIEKIFQRANIETRIYQSDVNLDSTIAQQATGRPGEEDRWDERELHEMMATFYSRPNLNLREWWAYLLIVSRFDGGIGSSKEKNDATKGMMFDKVTRNIGSLHNSRSRQGAAIFWKSISNPSDSSGPENWEQDRNFIYYIIHELGHILNLPHTLEDRPNSTSFMRSFPHWKKFKYEFDIEELFHIHHGFYNEVIPGGDLAYRQWTSSSIFHTSSSDSEQPNLVLTINPTRTVFPFTETVTITVTIKNIGSQDISIGRLSPAYGDLRFFIRKPNGIIKKYETPLTKCTLEEEILSPGKHKSHFTSLAVNSDGFTFDTPGYYEIVATLLDKTNNEKKVVSPSIYILIEAPNETEEKIANLIFNRDSSLFLYMGGGNHLRRAKENFEEIANSYGDHPTANHANLILGLNELAGQKRVGKCDGQKELTITVDKSNPSAACVYFEKVQKKVQKEERPTINKKRLEDTLKLCKQ